MVTLLLLLLLVPLLHGVGRRKESLTANLPCMFTSRPLADASHP
jgi:hypothetical protein